MKASRSSLRLGAHRHFHDVLVLNLGETAVLVLKK